MKAVVVTKYGSPDVLELREIEKPTPGENEILIRIRATTVHTGDCELRRFDIMPLFWVPLRLMMGVWRPRGNRVLGQEVAGVVSEVGPGVTRFKPGDQIIASTGLGMGGCAEYVCLPDKRAMAKKPAGLSFEEAAGITVGGQNALHFLRKAEVQSGQQVLIYGSTGAIGTYAVQLAKYFGAEVSAVCSTGKIELVESLGADHIIDYTREDFTKNGRTYDVIFDTIGKSPRGGSMKSLREGGVYIQANPSMGDMVRGPINNRRNDKQILLQFAGDNSEDLNFLTGLFEEGKLVSVIDRSYPLEETAEAHRYVEEGHKRGNVAITVVPDRNPNQGTAS